jgi:hypothetical protein
MYSMLASYTTQIGHNYTAIATQLDNECAIGVTDDTVKQCCLKAMDMHFYWVRDRVQKLQIIVHWKTGTPQSG